MFFSSNRNFSFCRNLHENGTRRNSCLGSSNPYFTKLQEENQNYSIFAEQEKDSILLNIPPVRKISDCSTNSSLSGDEFEVTELQPVKPSKVSNSNFRNTIFLLFFLLNNILKLNFKYLINSIFEFNLLFIY